MMGWRSRFKSLDLIAILLGLLVSRGFVRGQHDRDNLEWKAFEKSSGPFYQVVTTNTVQVIKLGDVELRSEQNHAFYIKWTPQDRDKDGNWVVKQQIIAVKIDIDNCGRKIQYDSATDEAKQNPIAEFFEPVIGPELTFHIRPADFKIMQLHGQEDLRKDLPPLNPARKQMSEPCWAAFPSADDRTTEPYKSRRTWKRVSEVDLGAIGLYEFSNTYQWQDKDKVIIHSTVKYRARPHAEDKQGIPFVIKDGNLDTKKGEGYAQFDRAKGRFSEVKLHIELVGMVSIEIGGMPVDVELRQTQRSTVEARDHDPIKAAKKAKQ